MINAPKISIIGLGYVGLPLSVLFAEQFKVIGFDINKDRIGELKKGIDRTKEVSTSELSLTEAHFTFQEEDLADTDVFIVTVPTPVDSHNHPDLNPLIKASKVVAKYLKKNAIVVYESTVYPGCSEEVCVPILESISGLGYNKDFFLGYSPERVNPGDKDKTLEKILKIVSGSTPVVTDFLAELYGKVITAGIYRASSIKVAEAAKAIENAQRDINIAFVNELSMIFEKMGLDTLEVLAAAGTKWNFLPFKPGLVGGHCIGVDPYYLTFKSEELGYHPQVILAGRKINDNMGEYIAQLVVKKMIKKGIAIHSANVLVLGITFKENCPDIRNSRVIDIIDELKDFGCKVTIHDPYANAVEVKHEYGAEMTGDECLENFNAYSAVVFAVAHDEYKNLDLGKHSARSNVIFDVKGIFAKELTDGRL